MCDYIKEEVYDDHFETIYVKEEITNEENLDLNAVIKQEPEWDQCSTATDTEQFISHSDEIDIKCEPCDKDQSGANKQEIFKCDICDKIYNRKGSLTSHIKYTHATDKSFKCGVCLESFPTVKVLKRHSLSHGEKKPFKCDLCPKTFRNKYVLTCHKAQEHGTGGKFSCEICGKMYLTLYKLKEHSVTHTDEMNFACDICEKRFKTKGNLTSHMKCMHATDKSFECEVCLMTFSTAYFLKAHTMSHSEGRPFRCDLCHKTFKIQYVLTCHMAHAHNTGGKFSCDVCGKMYFTVSKFEQHMMKHKDELNFECDECHKRFKSKANVAKHKRNAHASEKPFQCEVCAKTFAEEYFLKSHALWHSKEKSFQCHVCSRSYKSKGGMHWHIKKAHKVGGVGTFDDLKE